MLVAIKEGLKSGRLRQLTVEEAKDYQFELKNTKEGDTLLERMIKDGLKAFWDNQENVIVYGYYGD